MAWWYGTAAFEQVEKPGDVAIDVYLRVGERVANAGLGGKMTDVAEAVLLEQAFERSGVFELRTDEGVAAGAQRRIPRNCAGRDGVAGGDADRDTALGEARFLQRDVVVVVEAVESDHRVAGGQQASHGVIADEAGGTGDEDDGPGLCSDRVRVGL